MYNDKFLDYYAVVEQTTDPSPVQILDFKECNGLNYLRFRAGLQTFGHRNRNRRLWQSSHIKAMLQSDHVPELLSRSGIPGESGHPVPAVGNVTMERILTIDPNNMSHVIKAFEWSGDSKLYGIIETLDEGPGTPGYRFMRNILQKMDPSFSLRSIVPQRKNADGSTDVTGPGRFITYDRVILPSHSEAYIDKSVPIKNIITKSNFETAMESFGMDMIQRSEKVNRIIDNMYPAMESATVDKNGIFSITTETNGKLFIAPEAKHRNEIRNIMKNL